MARHKRYLVSILLAFSLLVPCGTAFSMTSANFTVPGEALSGGGGKASSAGYKNSALAGQSSPVGGTTSAGSKNFMGFWYLVSNATGTDPWMKDTDNDGYSDGLETSLGSDPNNAGSAPYAVTLTGTGTVNYIYRTDGGDPTNNLIGGLPKLFDFQFKVFVKDLSGAPQHVRLYTAQRSNPSSLDYFATDITSNCTGSFTTGALCAYQTKLGPASVHKFYFETLTHDGHVVSTTAAAGPQVQLLNGYSMVGAARDLATGAATTLNASTYRWESTGLTTDSNKGSYTLVASAAPAKTGEGYYLKRLAEAVLPELADSQDVGAATVKIVLSPGWNMISNPFGANVKLSSLSVQRDAATAVSWSSATSFGWLTNALYYYTGSDWGGTNAFESAGGNPDATLVPWMGYWIYVKQADATYSLIVPKP